MKLNEEQTKELNIKEGQKLTIMTYGAVSKTEVKISRILDGRPLYKEFRKRKEYYLPLNTGTLIFEGWDISLKTEAESSSSFFMMDAKINFVGTVEEVKTFINTRNINTFFDDYHKEKIDAIGSIEAHAESRTRESVYKAAA